MISVLDVGVLTPACILGAVLLLKKHPWGYLLATIMIFKGLTMGLAITAMVINQLLAGVSMSVVEVVMFLLLSALMIYMAVRMLRSIQTS